MTDKAIEQRVHLDAPLDEVWTALVDPAKVGTWCAARANVIPERGGAYELFWQPDTPDHGSTIGCRITAISRGRYIAFTWRGPDQFLALMDEGDPPPPPTHVTITLSPVARGTDLTLRHVGFSEGNDWAEALAWHDRSWKTCLGNLAAFVTGKPLPHPWT